MVIMMKGRREMELRRGDYGLGEGEEAVVGLLERDEDEMGGGLPW